MIMLPHVKLRESLRRSLSQNSQETRNEVGRRKLSETQDKEESEVSPLSY